VFTMYAMSGPAKVLWSRLHRRASPPAAAS
jgi:hypothetical protein